MRHFAIILILLLSPAVLAQSAGLDSLSDDALMNELALRGMDALLDRAFEVNRVPRSEQGARRAVIAVTRLADKSVQLSAKERQTAIDNAIGSIDGVLRAIREPGTLMQLAGVLIDERVGTNVNLLEYWGANPTIMAQLRPAAEAVGKLYEQAYQTAGDKAAEIANSVGNPNDPKVKEIERLDQLSGIAMYSARMNDYAIALSIEPADAVRRETADRAIAYLKDLDTDDQPIRALIRTQLGKLHMVRGDYSSARKLFASVESLKPDPSQLYQAKYFLAAIEILDRKPDAAQAALDALMDWQKTNLPPDKTSQDGAAAAAAVLQYRIWDLRSAMETDPARKKAAGENAIAVLTRLVKERPEFAPTINELLLTRLPDNADLSKQDALLLQSLIRRGLVEARKPEKEQPDRKALERAVQASIELSSRGGQPGVDPKDVEDAVFYLPFFEQRLGRAVESAEGFVAFLENYGKSDRARTAFENALAGIGALLRSQPGDAAVGRVYERFLPIAIAAPYNRSDFAFEFAVRLQKLGQFDQAIEYYKLVPADNPRSLDARFLQCVATKQVLDQTAIDSPDRPKRLKEIQTLADQVKQEGSARVASASDEKVRQGARATVVRTALLAAELARADQKDPARALILLEGIESQTEGLPNQPALVREALYIRVQSLMALGRSNDATQSLLTLLRNSEGQQGAAIVYSLLEKLNNDFDRAQSIDDRAAMVDLAKNRAQLSGFLIDWAKNNPDEKVRRYTYRYTVFSADTKHRAADLESDPAARKAGHENALKVYLSLDNPAALDQYRATLPPTATPEQKAYDPSVWRGIGLLSYDLGDYVEAQKRLGVLLNEKKLGAAVREIEESGGKRVVDNDSYWEATLKYIRSNLKLAGDDASIVDAQKRYLKQHYIRNPHVGGKKWGPDFDQLRRELIPDFDPAAIPASQPATRPAQ